MSQMNSVVVMACKRCGKPVLVTHLSTTEADAGGELLGQLMQGLKDIAYCPYHLKQRNYYAAIGRMDDWEAGRP